MYKQYISSILIIALFLQFGCYSGRIVTTEEVRTNNNIDELTVMKRDSSQVYFEKPQFSVVNDTLKGQGRLILLESPVSHLNDYNIPISDIVSFETSRFDPVKTFVLTGFVAAAIYLIVKAIKQSDLVDLGVGNFTF